MGGTSSHRKSAESADEWEQLASEKVKRAEANRERDRKLAYDEYGYAVERSLKATIMRKKGLNRWPDRTDRPELYTHSLSTLLKETGLFQRFCRDRRQNGRLRQNWLVVKDWAPSRYRMQQPSPENVRDLRKAITDPNDGILTWLKRQ